VPNLVLLGIQLAINNSKAGLEALLGRESDFVRTPKTGELHLSSDGANKKKKLSENSGQHYKPLPPKGAIFEFLIAAVYSIILVWAFSHQHWFMLPFISLLALGFVMSAFNSFYSHYRLSK